MPFNDNRLVVSDRFYNNLKHPSAIYSCGCPEGEKVNLWDEYNLKNNEKFDFNLAYHIKSNWCKDHGSVTFNELLEQG